MTVVQTETVADKDNDEETEKTNNRRSLIEHIKEQRNSKLNKTKNVDQQQLSVLKELTIKKEIISDMKENDRQYQHTMARFAATMENLSQTVSTMVGMIGSAMVASQPSSTIPNWQQNNGDQRVLYGRVRNGGCNSLICM